MMSAQMQMVLLMVNQLAMQRVYQSVVKLVMMLVSM